MSINGKQRSYLKKLANQISPLLQVGKAGLTEDVFQQLDELLNAHELVKINVLNNSGVDVRAMVEPILTETNAEFVQCIGHKLTVYRQSEEPKIELPR